METEHSHDFISYKGNIAIGYCVLKGLWYKTKPKWCSLGNQTPAFCVILLTKLKNCYKQNFTTNGTMELEKGECFSCNSKKLILNQCSERIQQIFVYLYPETVLNVNKLQSITPSLKFCPVCHHKLILLEGIYKCIQANQTVEDENCTLCKKGEFIFKISKSHFKDIFDDFPVFSDENKYDVCSQCFFYLDCRYHLKKRLFSKYPQLRVVPKLKLKFGAEITSHSTPFSTRKRERTPQCKRSSEVIFISSSESECSPPVTQKGLDLSSIKSLKALKDMKLLHKSKKICKDSKLLNQILYVELCRSKNIEAHKDLTIQHQASPRKKPTIIEKSKNSDEMKTCLEKNESRFADKELEVVEKFVTNSEISAQKSDNETSEFVPVSDIDTGPKISEDTLNMKNRTYFKIKLKKPSTRTNKSVKRKLGKNNTIIDNFKKSLVINLVRKAMLHGTTNQHNEKHAENDEDISIEVAESEEKSQLDIVNLRMDIDSSDCSKTEEPGLLKIAEDNDSEMINNDKNQSENNHEKSSDVCEKLDNGDVTEKSHDVEESNENTTSNSQCDKSEPEVDEHVQCDDDKKSNSDEKEPSEDGEEKEESLIERRKQIPDEVIEGGMKDKIPDEKVAPQTAVNEEDGNEQSDDINEDACSETKADVDQQKTDDKTKTDAKKLPGDREETDDKESPSDDEETDEVITGSEKENKETEGKEETDDGKTDNTKEINDRTGNSDERVSVSNEKAEEIGIDDEDRDNIDKMLSGLAADVTAKQSQEDSEDTENGATGDSKDVGGVDQDIETGCKRKRTDSPDVSSSPEKKKKKVTFSEDVLESSE